MLAEKALPATALAVEASVRLYAPIFKTPVVSVNVVFTVSAFARLTPAALLMRRLLNVVDDVPPIDCAAVVPLKVTVLAVDVVNILLLLQFPAIFIAAVPVPVEYVPLLVRFPEILTVDVPVV